MREIVLPVRVTESREFWSPAHIWDAHGIIAECYGRVVTDEIAAAVNDHAALQAQVAALTSERDEANARLAAELRREDALTAEIVGVTDARERMQAERNRLREQAATLREALTEASKHIPGAFLTRDVGRCEQCGAATSSGMLRMCDSCARTAAHEALWSVPTNWTRIAAARAAVCAAATALMDAVDALAADGGGG